MLSEAGVSLCRLVSNTVAGDCTLGGSSKPSQTPSFLKVAVVLLVLEVGRARVLEPYRESTEQALIGFLKDS